MRAEKLGHDLVYRGNYSHASLVTDGVRTALQSVSQHIVHQVQLYIDTFLCHYTLRSTLLFVQIQLMCGAARINLLSVNASSDDPNQLNIF